ncbi:MAG TPA: hypothetical protein VKD91_08025 [Pyrinomonadaceae bacterium]|nr:hypothetical protein [Pyrinomonadaceae bacterium]
MAHTFPAASLPIRWKGENVDVESLPFTPGDVTAGTENELQAEVCGPPNQVDLPVTLRRSRYFSNLSRRVASDEAPRQLVARLERYLDDQTHIWANSWVRFPRNSLSAFAAEVLERDLRQSDAPASKARSDRSRFVFAGTWGDWARVPISYLLRLSLADFIGRELSVVSPLRATAVNAMKNFANDLTSPETHSLYVIDPGHGSLGKQVAAEMGIRFLLTHLLVEWANKVIGLETFGQVAAVYFSPHPPVRQRELNDCISDSFYSELFISPCLSGWQDGEAKQEYMRLAYRTTSRSRINAVVKLRDAGLVPNNLVVLPNTSSVSLANNGTHVSLGSKRLTKLLSDPFSNFTAADEKRIGDLVIKISEHFLPLFVGLYSAAPYRLAFADLHPELALGFLPHALDYTHLRMLWRHLKRKAHLQFLGRPVSPFGPIWLDRAISGLFRVRGDLVPDHRLIDFPVAWLATEGASALDGTLGNVERLSQDLDGMGVTDQRLKFYMPISLRDFSSRGFSGFEGRHYSIFAGLERDLEPAVALQQLITVLAFKYAVSGKYQHANIPDDPSSESERRVPFFYSALGLPAFNVRFNTPNDLLRRIVSLTGSGTSSRHRNYLRVPQQEYLLALVRIIEEDGADIVELLQFQEQLTELKHRILDLRGRTYARILRGICGHDDEASAIAIDAREFNLAAESFYRNELKRDTLLEAIGYLKHSSEADPQTREAMQRTTNLDLSEFLRKIEGPLVNDRLSGPELQTLIKMVLAAVPGQRTVDDEQRELLLPFCDHTSIHRSSHATGA